MCACNGNKGGKHYCTGQLNIWSGCMWPLNPNEFEVPDLDFKLKGATAGK